MKKLIVHPGSPKTATSTIQHVLRQNRAKLEQAGIGLILPGDIRGHSYLGAYLASYRSDEPFDISHASAEFYEKYISQFDTVIVSEETFCHDFMPSKKFGYGGIDRAETSAELISQNPFDKTEIVLTIRPHVEFIISTYTHFVHRHREGRSFDHWYKDVVGLHRFSWETAVSAFKSQFSPEDVKVVSMSTAKENGIGHYVRDVIIALGLEGVLPDPTVGEVHNPSPSKRAVELCTMLNQTIVNPKKSNLVNTFIVENFPTSEFGKFAPVVQLQPEVRHMFHRDYALAVGKPEALSE
ncbi:hypothetical protein [Paracoccus alkanivorans]|uniref:Sulfotransferase domain-containing protein n=1 Tax=Paracoccus alkanivorans TaxID=2116655 RepID=A0A3M0LWG3_9RHOB|nr:hypothetical protein [Paracoccus alkanivorans]RMC29676.1 hypothetical protein C9E81_22460 [Paracoccus alkanivorans]